MKSGIVKIFFAALLMLPGALRAQQPQEFGPQWGENATQEERRQNALVWNYYQDAYNNQNYDLALEYMRTLIANAPHALNNIYVYGINIYKNKIARSRSLEERNALTDSLMNLYNLRIEYFGDDPKYGTSYIMPIMARDYLLFKPADREGVRMHFRNAIEYNKDNVDPDFINIYFKELTDDYLNLLVETDFYMNEYERMSELLNTVADSSAGEAKNTLDALFITSGAANCENIERIFKGRLESNPDDTDNLSKAFSLLTKSECHTPFYFEVGERYFQLQPTSATAMILATAYEKEGKVDKSLQFLRAAVESETNPVDKARLSVQISGTELRNHNARSAADFARQAISIDPENGLAYIFLAQAYVEGAQSNCTGFDKQAVYWLAYDAIMNARRLLQNDPEQLRMADELAVAYRQQFPATEEIFFRVLSEGAPYDVKCGWITGRTTVRAGK